MPKERTLRITRCRRGATWRIRRPCVLEVHQVIENYDAHRHTRVQSVDDPAYQPSGALLARQRAVTEKRCAGVGLDRSASDRLGSFYPAS
jgi:hypothetical protein